MAKGNSKLSKGGGGGTTTVQTGEAPALDHKLIRRANEAGTVVDYGDSTARQYQKNVDEIKNMDLTDTERKDAYNTLHQLTEAQLTAEASARGQYAPGMGLARFNKAQMSRNADNAVNAKAKVDSFMDNLRSAQKKKAAQKENNAMMEAMNKAIREGALSFTVNGKTYTRKSTRSKTFTR